jgi:hypothetical protein
MNPGSAVSFLYLRFEDPGTLWADNVMLYE